MSFARSLSIYTLSSILASGMPLLLLPVLTRQLSTVDYGIIATLTTLIAFFGPPVLWGTHALIGVEYFRGDRKDFPSRFTSGLLIPIVSVFLLVTLAWALRGPASRWLQVPAAWIVAAPALAGLTVLPLLQLTLLRMRQQAVTYGITELTNAAAVVTLTLGLVVGLHLGWQGRVLATAFAGSTLTLWAAIWLLRNGFVSRTIDAEAIRETLRFGAGVVPHDLFNQVIRLADRLFIVTLAGQAAAGQYAVATQLTSVLLVLLTAFNRAWVPYLFSQLPSATPEVRVQVVRRSYAVIGAFAVLFLAFNAAVPWVYRLLVAPKFHSSQAYVPWLSLGYFFLAVYLTYVDYIFYEKKTHLLSLITFVNMSINLTLNYVLVPRLGPQGAAMAFALTMAVVMVLAFLVSRRLHPMPWLFWLRRRNA